MANYVSFSKLQSMKSNGKEEHSRLDIRNDWREDSCYTVNGSVERT